MANEKLQYTAAGDTLTITLVNDNEEVLRTLTISNGEVPDEVANGDEAVSLKLYGIRKVLEALKSGGTVMLFPEGKISSTGELQPLQQGLLRIIERTCAITVPVRIDGLATSSFGRAPASKRKWYPTISIVAQEPIAAGGASFQDAVRDALGG